MDRGEGFAGVGAEDRVHVARSDVLDLMQTRRLAAQDCRPGGLDGRPQGLRRGFHHGPVEVTMRRYDAPAMSRDVRNCVVGIERVRNCRKNLDRLAVGSRERHLVFHKAQNVLEKRCVADGVGTGRRRDVYVYEVYLRSNGIPNS